MKRPSFDSLTLRAVIHELTDLLPGSQVQRIRQPDDFTILMRVHKYPETRTLLLSIHPEEFRVHWTDASFDNPPNAPTFCMAMRKYLDGGRVTDVSQEGADRVMVIRVSSAHGSFRLVSELMGRHSNIVLTAEDGNVVESIKHVGPSMSRRIVLPGRPYPPLPKTERPSLWDTPPSTLETLWMEAPQPMTKAWIMSAFSGMSPFLASHLAMTPSPAKFRNWVEQIRASVYHPVQLIDESGRSVAAYPIPSAAWPADQQVSALSLSAALDEAYSVRSADAQRNSLLREIESILHAEEETIARRERELNFIRQGQEQIEAWRIAGQLLMENAHSLKRGLTAVSLPNYYDPEYRPLEIALDPALSPRENADAYFTRARKAGAASERLPRWERELAKRRALLHSERERIATCTDQELLQWLENRKPPQTSVSVSRKREVSEYPPGVRIRKWTSDDGWQIWVGENATGNDYLTTKASDPDDLWFHVRAAASAHGVIRTNRKPQSVPHSAIERAARLVADRSEIKNSGIIPVDYTLRRYVRKPRNAAPGRVTYEREKTIYIENE